MKEKRQHQPGNRAVTLLATCVVVTLGLGLCLAVAVSGSRDSSAVWICLACFGGLTLMLWGMFESSGERPEGARSFLFFWRGGRKEAEDYVVVRRRELPPEEFPDVSKRPEPPSAESVRRLREENATKTWVPSPMMPGAAPPADDSAPRL